MDYTSLKLLHIVFAMISISGFITRGILTLKQSSLLHRRWLRILPHINDTLLLLSAIALAIQTDNSPWQHGWLAAKIVLLMVYIGLGLMTLRIAKSRTTRLIFFSLAILTFTWIVAIAISKSTILF